MILSGKLSDFSLADILQLLGQQKKSGILNLQHAKEFAELHISEGNISGVKINNRVPETKILEMLKELGRVTSWEMGELSKIAGDSDYSVIKILISKGKLDQMEFQEWVEICGEDMVGELFSWIRGQYEFTSEAKSSTNEFTPLAIAIDMACMEGMRRLDEWPRLQEMIPTTGLIFRKIESDSNEYDLQSEEMILDAVDGRRNVAQIEKRVPFGRFSVYDSLLNFWNEGFIEPIPDSPSAAEASLDDLSDLEAEKERKTALVVAIAVLSLSVAILIRITTLYQHGSQAKKEDQYSGWVENRLKRENIELLLNETAFHQNTYPEELDYFTEREILNPAELKQSSGGWFLIQQSSRLTYACLLIHRNRLDLAAYLLDTFHHLRDPRVLSLVLCLRVYLLALQSRFSQAKSLAIRHLEQHPSDTTALSLLQFVIVSEQGLNVGRNEPSTSQQPSVVGQGFGYQEEKDEGTENPYETVCEDPQTKLLVTWNPSPNSLLITSKDSNYKHLGKILPTILPSEISRSCQLLDGGEIRKLEMQWEKIQIISWHSDKGHLALVTGRHKDARITVARAEGIFRKEVG